VLYHAPYEVTETGWGEFVIGIQIDFHAASGLEPIVLSHTLKLFPLPNVQPSTKKPVSAPDGSAAVSLWLDTCSIR
jgi:YEATS domain-containing protein 4